MLSKSLQCLKVARQYWGTRWLLLWPLLCCAVLCCAQIEFKRLIIDEVQHMGASSSQVAQLACAVPAQHKLVMSGRRGSAA
jgi:hypothetical protein